MTRYHFINGNKVAFTAEEEAARDAEEAAVATKKRLMNIKRNVEKLSRHYKNN